MTDEQKAARAEKARLAREAAAKERSDAIEAEDNAVIRRLDREGRIPQDSMRVFNYIRKQIASGARTAKDVEFLRETRRLRLSRFLPRNGGES